VMLSHMVDQSVILLQNCERREKRSFVSSEDRDVKRVPNQRITPVTDFGERCENGAEVIPHCTLNDIVFHSSAYLSVGLAINTTYYDGSTRRQ